MLTRLRIFAALIIYAAAAASVASAQAQTEPAAVAGSPAETTLGEVIVTARKRQESILNVPVVETAVPQQLLERTQTLDIRDLEKLVPGLNLGHALLSIGTLVSIRGIGTASLDPGIDQSVALNIDGMALVKGWHSRAVHLT